MKLISCALALLLVMTAPVHAGEATRLFSEDAPISIKIAADWRKVGASDPGDPPVPGVLTAGAETLPIEILTRGKSRRDKAVCDFPPLSVVFPDKPGEASLFHKQRKLKLVTYCKKAPSHQQVVLKEYAAYRAYNVITPQSYRVRLAELSYEDAKSGKLVIARSGFFIEDTDDLARRVDMKEVKRGRTAVGKFDAAAAARVSLFHYMIGNLDWDMTAGPEGENCCHNGKIIGPTENAETGLVPAPYDFDMSGFVDAPYAVVPEILNVTSVKTRVYRGFCVHNDQTRAVAIAFRARRADIESAIAATPGLNDSAVLKATNFLDGFFKAVADDAAVEKNLIRKCRG